MTKRSLLSISLLVAALATCRVASAATTATLTIPIDQTWRAIGPVGDLTGQGINNVGLAWEASHPGWNANLGFDDSAAAGWTNAIEVIHPNPPFTRYWVDGTETVGSSPAYFRKLFVIPGAPQDGALDFNVDDDAQVYVNGQLVYDEASGLADDVTDVGVTVHLHTGLNLIAIKAHDQQGAQSIAGRLDVLYVVPEPSTLALALLTLAGNPRHRWVRKRESACNL